MSLSSFFLQTIAPVMPADSVPSPKAELGMLKSLSFDEFIDKLVSGIVTLAINVALAVLVFYVGKFIINKIYNVVHGIMLRRNVETSLSTFVLSFVRIVLYFILIVTVIGILGIETSSFLAIFASAGVAIGMALSGTLQNFAGGVLILLLKPYRVNDYIEAQGYSGTVREIQIFHTLITTPDNKSIIIPNGGLSTGSINNWSRQKYRRVDWTIGISYDSSVATARKVILDIIGADSRVLRPDAIVSDSDTADDNAMTASAAPEQPRHRRRIFGFLSGKKKQIEERREIQRKRFEALGRPDFTPSVVLSDLADSSVVLKVRAWTLTADYWPVYHEVLERIFNTLPDTGVSFPFPQLDVHINPENPHRQ